MSTMAVSANIYTEDPQQVIQAVEVLSRAAAGLALDGIDISVSVHRIDDEDNDE